MVVLKVSWRGSIAPARAPVHGLPRPRARLRPLLQRHLLLAAREPAAAGPGALGGLSLSDNSNPNALKDTYDYSCH